MSSRTHTLLTVVLAVAVAGVLLLWYRDREVQQQDAALRARFTCPVGLAPVMPQGEGAPPLAALTKLFDAQDPTALAVREGDDAVWITEQAGRVLRVSPPAWDVEVALDLTAAVTAGGEQGLLGLAFGPQGDRLYLHYTDLQGDSSVVEFRVDRSGRADAGSRRQVLIVEQPGHEHNGGQLAFGPDEMLYVAFGDGGGQADPDDNAQDLETLLGKILRIDPRPDGDRAYGIPEDNPFVGVDGARPEIYAYGLRNPWRFSFQPGTGAMWVADVGDGCFEEISVIAAENAGANLGWDHVEGFWTVDELAPEGAVLPRFAYERSLPPCAVVGGYVYSGARISALRGSYVFSDYCGDWLAAVPVDEEKPESRVVAAAPVGVTSLAQGLDGELFVLTASDGVYRVDPVP